MNTEQMRQAMQEAKQTMRAAGNCANDLAECLVGRLKGVSTYKLAQLKKELANYNIHTGRWKS